MYSLANNVLLTISIYHIIAFFLKAAKRRDGTAVPQRTVVLSVRCTDGRVKTVRLTVQVERGQYGERYGSRIPVVRILVLLTALWLSVVKMRLSYSPPPPRPRLSNGPEKVLCV